MGFCDGKNALFFKTRDREKKEHTHTKKKGTHMHEYQLGCPSGYFNSKSGEKLMSKCLVCPDGTFTPDGSKRCTQCPAGRFMKYTAFPTALIPFPSRGKDCSFCDSGLYSDLAYPQTNDKCYFYDGSVTTCVYSSCSTCPAGKISVRLHNAACTSCPPGKTQKETTCELCSRGRFQMTSENSGSICSEECPAGKYSNLGASVCTSCSIGRYQIMVETEIEIYPKCNPCLGGYYQSVTGSDTCIKCEPGTFSLDGAAHCTQCPEGKFQKFRAYPETSMERVTYDRADAQLTICESCPLGQYNNRPGRIRCQLCPLGVTCTSFKKRKLTLNISLFIHLVFVKYCAFFFSLHQISTHAHTPSHLCVCVH